MKRIGLISISLLLMTSFWSCKKQPQQTVVEEKPLPTFMDSVSYAYGISIGKDFEKNKIEGMSGKFIGQGITSVTDTAAVQLLTEEQSKLVIQEFAQKLQAEQAKIAAEKKALAKKEGKDFLVENA